jgi:hypothetical protein
MIAIVLTTGRHKGAQLELVEGPHDLGGSAPFYLASWPDGLVTWVNGGEFRPLTAWQPDLFEGVKAL